MEKMKQVEELINEEVITLETKIKQLNEVIKLLKQENNFPEEIKREDIPIIKATEDKSDLKEKFKNYPVAGKQRDKVRFILTTYGRAISDSEFETVINQMEGAKAVKSLEVFQRTLRGLTHPKFGEIMQFNFVNNNIRFYIKPEWRGHDKASVIKEKLPVPNELNLLDKNVLINPICVFKTAEWIN